MAVERSKRWEIFDSVTNRGCHINMGHHGPHSHKTVEVCTTDDESSNRINLGLGYEDAKFNYSIHRQ